MPELPDVSAFKDYLERTAVGRQVLEAEVVDARILRNVTPTAFARAVRGHRLAKARRHGKLLFAQLDSGGALAMHFGMTGELAAYSTGTERPRYARVVFTLDRGRELAYLNRRMLGWVGIVADVDAFLADEKIGPDALDEGLNYAAFRDRLQGRSAAIKSILMDQQVIAGIGSVWGDEVLFHAGIDPRRPVRDLGDRELHALYTAARRVLRTGARHGGVAARLPKGYLLPHRDEGACPRCGGPLKKIKVSGRPTHFCPNCQR